MKEVIEIVTPLHLSTQRDYLGRMIDDKVNCMKIAKKYGQDYWDGNRRFGYGGYKYITGRWSPVAEALIERYGLSEFKCFRHWIMAKPTFFMENEKMLPGLQVSGFDISVHGLNALDPIKENLFIHSAKDPLPFDDQEFDLAYP